MNYQRRRQSRAAIAAFGCVVVFAAGCTGQPTDVTGSSASAASKSAASSAVAATGTAAELQKQVELYLSPGGRYDELVKSILVNVDGHDLVAHYSADSGQAVAHNVYSVTKSVMSMLVGIAINEGKIGSVDATLAQLLPQYAPKMASGVGAVTLEQLLMMTGGLAPDDRSTRYRPGVDWTAITVAEALWQPPGTGFLYSNPAAHLLSAILVRATKMSVLDYARVKLFDPLGISTTPAEEPVLSVEDLPAYDARPGFGWSTDPQGLHLGMSDLKITAADMIKLGRLYLQQGRWDGKQLVPAEWVQNSSRSHVTAGDGPAGTIVGYGYLWWVHSPGEHPAYAAMGYAGQLIEVVPDLQLVVAVSCKDAPASFDATDFAQMIDRQIIPVLTG